MCETARGGPDAKKEISRQLHMWSEYDYAGLAKYHDKVSHRAARLPPQDPTRDTPRELIIQRMAAKAKIGQLSRAAGAADGGVVVEPTTATFATQQKVHPPRLF
jgi:hypothetical protein